MDETREITVTCTWRSDHRVEVPVGWQHDGSTLDFPADVLEELTPQAAELVDWEVRG